VKIFPCHTWPIFATLDKRSLEKEYSMAKTARKASSKASPKVSSSSKNSAYLRIRERIESMYALHLVLLVAMSCLSAAMFVIMMNQRLEIQKLEFERDFIDQRYTAVKSGMQQRQALLEAEEIGPFEE
jgi:hypothetical protein